MISREQLKEWIKDNGLSKDGTKLVPKTEARITKNADIVEALLHHTSFLEVDTLCERMYYIIKDWYEVKKCPTCKTQVAYNKIYCCIKCVANDPNVISKRSDTYKERTGFSNPSFNPEVKDKISISNKKNSKQAYEKRKLTNLKLYGVEHLFENDEYKLKAKHTTIRRYGVDNIFKSRLFTDNNTNPLLTSDLTEEQLLSKRNNIQQKRFKTLYNKGYFDVEGTIKMFSVTDYDLGMMDRKYKCLKCGNIFSRYSFNVTRCLNCFPLKENIMESEVYNFCTEIYDLTIKRADRQTISPLELDIHIIDKNIAIEFDGLLFHSYGTGEGFTLSHANNLDKENKNYHLTKTNLCKEKGISLLHIFENEWVNSAKREIWKSIIKSKLGINYRLYARKCIIKEVSSKDAMHFLNYNHLQGKCGATYHIGLYYNDELVSLLSISKSRFNKKYNFEITRYCNKLNTNVIGGFSKLLKYFRNNYNGSIITYADKRYSDGNMYKQAGFIELKDSTPNYFYCLPRKHELYSRIQFQKHKLKDKLKIFDESLSESQNMFNNGYRRIWDCGNKVFILEGQNEN